jgi:hypothetical protein
MGGDDPGLGGREFGAEEPQLGRNPRRRAVLHPDLCLVGKNPTEAQFGVLRRFTLANSNHPNQVVQTQRLHEYLRWRNAHPREPGILQAQHRERARVRSEKGHRWKRDTARAAWPTS